MRLEEVATPEAFARDPARVLAFYDARRRQLQHPSVTPNAAHEALARLEAVRPGEVMIATQNIDDLHERAGSRAVDPHARRAAEGALHRLRQDHRLV